MYILDSVPTSLKLYSRILREFLLSQKYALVDTFLGRVMALRSMRNCTVGCEILHIDVPSIL